jgi:hypothetical protein
MNRIKIEKVQIVFAQEGLKKKNIEHRTSNIESSKGGQVLNEKKDDEASVSS